MTMQQQQKGVDLSVPDQVYDVGRWRRLLYEFERDANKGLRSTESKGLSRTDLWPAFVRERFARYYSPRVPKLKEPTPGSEVVQELHGIQDAMPEEKALYAHTAGNEEKAGMAAAAVCRSVAAKMQPKKSKRNLQKLKRRVKGLEQMQEQGANVQKKLEKAEAQLATALQEAEQMAKGLDPSAIRQAIRVGCEQAQKELEELDDMRAGYSFGSEPGVPARMSAEESRALSKRLKENDKHRKIALLGRQLRAEASEYQKQKCDRERTQVSTIELGRDLNRMLPRELVDITSDSPNRRLLFAMRYAEGKCLQYKLTGKVSKQRGQIIFCADESGSQSGQPEIETKATALAFLEIARRQRRGWAYIHFDSSVTRVDSFPKDGQVEPGKLIDCMEWFTCGGTNFQAPLDKAVEMIEAEGFENADVLLITDGMCSTDAGWNDKFLKAKGRLKFKVFTVLTGHSHRPTIEKWSDEIFDFHELLQDSFKSKTYTI